MASAGTTPERRDEGIRDEFIREAEESGERRGSATCSTCA